MKEVLTFMENDPFLTFFFFIIVAQMVMGVFRSLAIAIRGWPTPEQRKAVEENKEKDLD